MKVSNPDSYKWKLVTGCYKNGEYIKMVKAIPGFTYNFDDVTVEVRATEDPFAGKIQEEEKEASDSTRKRSWFSFWRILFWIALVVFIILLIISIIILIVSLLYYIKVENSKKFVQSRASGDF